MSHTAKTLALSLVVGLLALTACSGSGTPTPDANSVYTQVAVTVQAELSRVAAQTPSATPTVEPTATQAATDTAAPTDAAAPTQASTVDASAPTAAPIVVATATQAASPDHGTYVSQSPADGTTYNPNETFTMTWTVKNTGTTTWSTKYLLRFYAGDQLGAPASAAFPKEVKPNDSIQLSVPMKAPSAAGKYLGNWVLTNADGVNFPTYLTIQVVVANTASATNTNAPAATQTSTPLSATAVPTATSAPTPVPTATP